jgi:hypothetical protein
MTPLTRHDLDQLVCGICGEGAEGHEHDPFYIHSRCHMDAPIWAIYTEGVIIFKCAECDREITKVSVAVG